VADVRHRIGRGGGGGRRRANNKNTTWKMDDNNGNVIAKQAGSRNRGNPTAVEQVD